jgi:cytochrome c oxidase assembly factor 6
MDKSDRDRCWAARDAYFACQSSSPATECATLREAFVQACPKSWVSHFEQRRVWLLEREKRLKQIAQMDREVTGK